MNIHDNIYNGNENLDIYAPTPFSELYYSKLVDKNKTYFNQIICYNQALKNELGTKRNILVFTSMKNRCSVRCF